MKSKIYKETCCSCDRCMVYEMKHMNCYKRELEDLRSQLSERSHSASLPATSDYAAAQKIWIKYCNEKGGYDGAFEKWLYQRLNSQGENCA